MMKQRQDMSSRTHGTSTKLSPCRDRLLSCLQTMLPIRWMLLTIPHQKMRALFQSLENEIRNQLLPRDRGMHVASSRTKGVRKSQPNGSGTGKPAARSTRLLKCRKGIGNSSSEHSRQKQGNSIQLGQRRRLNCIGVIGREVVHRHNRPFVMGRQTGWRDRSTSDFLRT